MFDGACPACHALSFNAVFTQRARRREEAAESGEPPSKFGRRDYNTSQEKSERLDERRAFAKQQHQKVVQSEADAFHARVSQHSERQQTQQLRESLTAVKALLSDLSLHAQSASVDVAMEAAAKVDVAVRAQQQAEASLESSQLSLLEMSRKASDLEYLVEQERTEQLMASVVAAMAARQMEETVSQKDAQQKEREVALEAASSEREAALTTAAAEREAALVTAAAKREAALKTAAEREAALKTEAEAALATSAVEQEAAAAAVASASATVAVEKEAAAAAVASASVTVAVEKEAAAAAVASASATVAMEKEAAAAAVASAAEREVALGAEKEAAWIASSALVASSAQRAAALVSAALDREAALLGEASEREVTIQEAVQSAEMEKLRADMEHAAHCAAVRHAASVRDAFNRRCTEQSEALKQAKIEAALKQLQSQGEHDAELAELRTELNTSRAKLQTMASSADFDREVCEAEREMEEQFRVSVEQAHWRLEEAIRSTVDAVHKVEREEKEMRDVMQRSFDHAVERVQQSADNQLIAQRTVHAAELEALPPVVKSLINASKLGNLDKFSETADILTDIASCLESGCTRGRRLSNASKTFYGMLLNSGSPYAHKFVSNVLFGQSLRESQRARAAFDDGLQEAGLVDESFKSLKQQLSAYGAETVPGIISEDATTALRRLDFEMFEHLDGDAWRIGIKLWGFSGGPKTVHSVDELRQLFQAKEALASYVYVYTWIPILKNAPWFPFALVASDNKFKNGWVMEQWRLMHKSAQNHGLRLAGHVSDGDARLRKCDFRMNFATNASADPMKWYRKHYFLKHSLLMLSVPESIEGTSLFAHQDYMHLAWRLRVQLLNPKKEWEIGPGLRVGWAHLDSLVDSSGDKLLNGKDLDPHNKQHWPGVIKIFSKKVADALKQRIDAGHGAEDHLKAT